MHHKTYRPLVPATSPASLHTYIVPPSSCITGSSPRHPHEADCRTNTSMPCIMSCSIENARPSLQGSAARPLGGLLCKRSLDSRSWRRHAMRPVRDVLPSRRGRCKVTKPGHFSGVHLSRAATLHIVVIVIRCRLSLTAGREGGGGGCPVNRHRDRQSTKSPKLLMAENGVPSAALSSSRAQRAQVSTGR